MQSVWKGMDWMLCRAGGSSLAVGRAGESWKGVWWAVPRATCLLLMPGAEARVLQQEMEGNHPKTFRRMAGGKGQELACAAAWDGVMVVSATLALLCINAYAEKTDSMGPGVWSTLHLGLLGVRAWHSHGRAQLVPGQPFPSPRSGRISLSIWEGSFYK